MNTGRRDKVVSAKVIQHRYEVLLVEGDALVECANPSLSRCLVLSAHTELARYTSTYANEIRNSSDQSVLSRLQVVWNRHNHRLITQLCHSRLVASHKPSILELWRKRRRRRRKDSLEIVIGDLSS